MTSRIRFALVLVALGTVLAGVCLVKTTALAMTMFFTFGLPLYGLAALIYVGEVLRDLRSHRVL